MKYVWMLMLLSSLVTIGCSNGGGNNAAKKPSDGDLKIDEKAVDNSYLKKYIGQSGKFIVDESVKQSYIDAKRANGEACKNLVKQADPRRESVRLISRSTRKSRYAIISESFRDQFTRRFDRKEARATVDSNELYLFDGGKTLSFHYVQNCSLTDSQCAKPHEGSSGLSSGKLPSIIPNTHYDVKGVSGPTIEEYGYYALPNGKKVRAFRSYYNTTGEIIAHHVTRDGISDESLGKQGIKTLYLVDTVDLPDNSDSKLSCTNISSVFYMTTVEDSDGLLFESGSELIDFGKD